MSTKNMSIHKLSIKLNLAISFDFQVGYQQAFHAEGWASYNL